ncbi:protein ADM2 isoform X2 [Tamandua tetradactyla]|uniref:protein ADM2 isoform X2 n=1 Tax=Tamandua tetradactyla TaxID=48850 RepID=UPI00405435D7
MARILAVALGCISLLYLHLPGVLARSLSRRPRPGRPRELPARTPSSGLKPQYLAPQPAAWKLGRAPQPQRSARPARAMGQPLQDRNRQHSGPHRLSSPRRPQAQLLRVGCVLGTCQVQNLSHRLWQLVGQASRREVAPVDPSNPHSYG